MNVSFASSILILLLVMEVMDPFGNIPRFETLLRNVEPRRRELLRGIEALVRQLQ